MQMHTLMPDCARCGRTGTRRATPHHAARSTVRDARAPPPPALHVSTSLALSLVWLSGACTTHRTLASSSSPSSLMLTQSSPRQISLQSRHNLATILPQSRRSRSLAASLPILSAMHACCEALASLIETGRATHLYTRRVALRVPPARVQVRVRVRVLRVPPARVWTARAADECMPPRSACF